jgi:hypothetical protein
MGMPGVTIAAELMRVQSVGGKFKRFPILLLV